MSESEEEAKKRELREIEGKNVAHYTVLLEAWIQIKMERDKTFITLSAAAIGLLVTILTTAGVPVAWHIFLYLGAFTGFIGTIFTSIKIYNLNSKHIENEIGAGPKKKIKMEKYDKRSFSFFMIGVICTCLIGMTAAYSQLKTNPEDTMSKGKKTTSVPTNDKTVLKSLDGLEDLKPQPRPKTKNTVNQPPSKGLSDPNSEPGDSPGSGQKK